MSDFTDDGEGAWAEHMAEQLNELDRLRSRVKALEEAGDALVERLEAAPAGGATALEADADAEARWQQARGEAGT